MIFSTNNKSVYLKATVYITTTKIFLAIINMYINKECYSLYSNFAINFRNVYKYFL